MTELYNNGIYSCGTARKDRKGFPTELQKVNLKDRYDYQQLHVNYIYNNYNSVLSYDLHLYSIVM